MPRIHASFGGCLMHALLYWCHDYRIEPCLWIHHCPKKAAFLPRSEARCSNHGHGRYSVGMAFMLGSLVPGPQLTAQPPLQCGFRLLWGRILPWSSSWALLSPAFFLLVKIGNGRRRFLSTIFPHRVGLRYDSARFCDHHAIFEQLFDQSIW